MSTLIRSLAEYGDYAEKNPVPRLSSAAGIQRIKRYPLNREGLGRLCRNQEDFLAHFTAKIEQMLQEGWLLPADAEKEIAATEIHAEAAFR